MTARSFLLLVPALLAVSPAVGMVVARRGAEADVKIVVSESSPAVVGFAAREDLPSGVVAQVLQRGYKLGERLLRPAKVMVNQ